MFDLRVERQDLASLPFGSPGRPDALAGSPKELRLERAHPVGIRASDRVQGRRFLGAERGRSLGHTPVLEAANPNECADPEMQRTP